MGFVWFYLTFFFFSSSPLVHSRFYLRISLFLSSPLLPHSLSHRSAHVRVHSVCMHTFFCCHCLIFLYFLTCIDLWLLFLSFCRNQVFERGFNTCDRGLILHNLFLFNAFDFCYLQGREES